jgi:hypothetical protein
MRNREELAKQVSPINYVRAGLPPNYHDPRRRSDIVPYTQAVRLHAALDKAGVTESTRDDSGASTAASNGRNL